MASRYTKYAPVPDQPYDPRVTDLTRPLRVPGLGMPASGGYPVGGTASGGTGQPIGSADAAAAGAQPVTVVDNFKNRNRTYTLPVLLTAGVPLRILPANFRRTGLIIQNRDPATALFYAFGNAADSNSLSIAAGGTVLLDFTTPRDEVWLLAVGSNLQAVIAEISRATD